MLDRLCKTISQAYDYHNGDAEEPSANDKNSACRIAHSGKMSAIVLAIITIVSALFALSSGGIGGFFLSLTMGALTMFAWDAWKVCDNIEKIVNAELVSRYAHTEFADNKSYSIAREATMGSWFIAPLTLAIIGR